MHGELILYDGFNTYKMERPLTSGLYILIVNPGDFAPQIKNTLIPKTKQYSALATHYNSYQEQKKWHLWRYPLLMPRMTVEMG